MTIETMNTVGTPRVTVVTPTYDRAGFLPMTLESVLSQGYQNLEYLILDDGSQDNTREIVARYGERVRYFYHENRGEAATVNRGWEMATGEYVAFVSSDDPMLPGWLQKSVSFMETHPDVIVGYPDWHMIDESGRVVQNMRVYDYDFRHMISWFYCMPGPGTIIRRIALTDVKPLRNTTYRFVSDYDMWLRLGLRGPFARIPHTLANWRYHAGVESIRPGTSYRRAQEHLRVMDEFFTRRDLPPDIAKLERKAKSRAWFAAAAQGQAEHPLRACYYLFRSYLASPLDPDNLPAELRRPRIIDYARSAARAIADFARRLLHRSQPGPKNPILFGALHIEAPLVSIVIPTYNRGDYILEAVESALNQSYRNIEVIVVDDGSADDTLLRLSKTEDTRLRTISMAHRGVSAARNAGTTASRGAYVAFLDSDDLFLRDKILLTLERFRQNPGLALVASDWIERINDHDTIVRTSTFGDPRHSLLTFNWAVTPTVVVRREVFDVVGYFDETLSVAEDCDLWSRIMIAGGRVAVIESPLSIIRRHCGNTRPTPELAEAAHKKIIKQFFQSGDTEGLKKRRYYAAVSLLNVARFHADRDQRFRAWYAFFRAFFRDPWVVLRHLIKRAGMMVPQIRRLVHQRDGLLRERDALLGERDALLVERDALRGERDALLVERKGLHGERDALLGERDALRGERDALLVDRKVLHGERDALLGERDALRGERDALLVDRDALRGERDALLVDRDALRGERDALLVDRDALRGERDALLGERDALRGERDALLVDREGLRGERDALLGERDTLRAEQDVLLARILGKMTVTESEAISTRRSVDQSLLQARGASNAHDALGVIRYLDLLEDCLVGKISEDLPFSPWSEKRFNADIRSIGRDWPVSAQTMIGSSRMRNLRQLTESVLIDNVPGDFIETGVWRGGACIYVRGIFKAYGVTDRRVWVADSFCGVPPPTPDVYPADINDLHHTFQALAVPLHEVKHNFEKYGLLDEQVQFLPGWFKDTLPSAPIEKLAILRLDGDMYESTMDALRALYSKVLPSGFVIVDDYNLSGCKAAVDTFRVEHQINAAIQDIDGAGVFWRKPQIS